MSRMIIRDSPRATRYTWFDKQNQTPCVPHNWRAGDIVHEINNGASVLGDDPTVVPLMTKNLHLTFRDTSRHDDTIRHFGSVINQLLQEGFISTCTLSILTTDAGIQSTFAPKTQSYGWRFFFHRGRHAHALQAASISVMLVKDGPLTRPVVCGTMTDAAITEKLDRMVSLAYRVRRLVIVRCDTYDNYQLFMEDIKHGRSKLKGFADFMHTSGGPNTTIYYVRFHCPIEQVAQLTTHVGLRYKPNCVRVVLVDKRYDTSSVATSERSRRRIDTVDGFWMPQSGVRPPYQFDFVASVVIVAHAVIRRYELIEVLERIPEIRLLPRNTLDALLSRLYASVQNVYNKREERSSRLAIKTE